jgi:hypothetical protein
MLPNPRSGRGITLSATYVGEVVGNAAGGLRQGALAQGRGAIAVDVDFVSRSSPSAGSAETCPGGACEHRSLRLDTLVPCAKMTIAPCYCAQRP